MKTAVDTVFVGKERTYNRRFLQMCAHYLVEPVACSPGAGWEKGQVENQVGVARQRLFTPRLRFKSYEELNAWLLDRCVAGAKAQPHPEVRDRTVWEMFEAERANLVPYAGPFDAFHAIPATVSKTCLVRFDNNKYSVLASAIAPSADRSRSEPTPSGSSCAGTAASPASSAASSVAARPCMIPGTTCRCWPASRARSGTGRRSRTGCCRHRSSACAASSVPRPVATVRWSTS